MIEYADYAAILSSLHVMENAANRKGMARYGIATENALGVSIPQLRGMAKKIGRDHTLARNLWDSGIHDARILACLVDDPRRITGEQMEAWVADFNSWDLCDQCCSNLFDKTPFAWQKAVEWSGREEEFVKRAAFVLMAALAVHDKKAGDERFLPFFPLILRESGDERNFVRKAVNWALRQIGKRNIRLHRLAIEIAEELSGEESRSARWIGRDALRELTGERVRKKLDRGC